MFSVYFRDIHFLLSCVYKKTFKFRAYALIAGRKHSTWLQSLGINISNLSRIYVGPNVKCNIFKVNIFYFYFR